MSLKPASPWIEKRGRQHRVYWRHTPGRGLPARSYQRCHSPADAQQFIDMAAYFGLDTARQVMATEDKVARWALLDAALAERGLVPADPVPRPAPQVPPAVPAGPPPLLAAPADPRLTGVTFDELWARFLTRIRYVDEGTHKLYEGYGRNHLLPFFGGTGIGLILRTRPLHAADAPAGALYVDDDWMTGILKKEQRNNAGRPIAGSLLSKKVVDNVLTVLGQCFDLAVVERPARLEINRRRRSGCPSTNAGRRSSSTTPPPTPRSAARCTSTSSRCWTSWSAPAPATARPPACGCSTCTWTPSGPTSTSGRRSSGAARRASAAGRRPARRSAASCCCRGWSRRCGRWSPARAPRTSCSPCSRTARCTTATSTDATGRRRSRPPVGRSPRGSDPRPAPHATDRRAAPR
ncbi:hypothetical protein ACI8AK_12755 [Geodermatophilus sp. SYSU D00867]